MLLPEWVQAIKNRLNDLPPKPWTKGPAVYLQPPEFCFKDDKGNVVALCQTEATRDLFFSAPQTLQHLIDSFETAHRALYEARAKYPNDKLFRDAIRKMETRDLSASRQR